MYRSPRLLQLLQHQYQASSSRTLRKSRRYYPYTVARVTYCAVELYYYYCSHVTNSSAVSIGPLTRKKALRKL